MAPIADVDTAAAAETAEPGVVALLKEDVMCVFDRDPAARNVFDVLTCYPGIHALIFYRFAHAAWVRGLRWPARFLSYLARAVTNVDIHPGAQIGRRFFIDHGACVVIGETAVVGDDVTLYHGVTLGGTALHQGKRHPTLKDGVIVGAGAKILGAITVGTEARVGSNAVVVADVPDGVTVVGIPAKAVTPRDKRDEHAFLPYGTPCGDIPDPTARALAGMMGEMAAMRRRIEELEGRNDPREVNGVVNGGMKGGIKPGSDPDYGESASQQATPCN